MVLRWFRGVLSSFAFVSLLATPSFAQSGLRTDLCATTSGSFDGFVVVTNTGQTLSSSEIPETIGANKPVMLRVCIPVDPSRHSLSGAVNIRVQVSATSEAKSNRAVELDSDRSKKKTASVSISSYQRFHGCSGQTQDILQREFHTSVGAGRTDDAVVKSRFLFTRDVPPSCDLFGNVADFIGHFPIVGTIGTVIIGPVYAGPATDLIIRRQSAIVKYNYPTSTNTIQYVSKDFGPFEINKCVRLEMSRLADPNPWSVLQPALTALAPVNPVARFVPQTIGFACIQN